MKELMKYIQDSENNVWRVNYKEGFAEPIPSSFADLGLNAGDDTIKYHGKIDNYLREVGAADIQFIPPQNKWKFSLVTYS